MLTMKMVCTFTRDSFITALQQLIEPLLLLTFHVLTAASGGGLEGKDQGSQGQACGSAKGSRWKAGASQIRQQARPGGAVCRPASGVEGAVGQEERRDLLWQPHNKGGEGWLLLLGACGGQSTYCTRVQAASRQMMKGFQNPLCNGFCIAGYKALGSKRLEACAQLVPAVLSNIAESQPDHPRSHHAPRNRSGRMCRGQAQRGRLVQDLAFISSADGL